MSRLGNYLSTNHQEIKKRVRHEAEKGEKGKEGEKGMSDTMMNDRKLVNLFK